VARLRDTAVMFVVNEMELDLLHKYELVGVTKFLDAR
jgi:hypothetical protein